VIVDMSFHINRVIPHIRVHACFLSIKARTTGLNGLNLSVSPWETVESGGKLGPIEEFALLGLNWAESSSGQAADGSLRERSATERAVLLSLGAVGSERVGENARGRSRVRARSVINGF
jgi:hypothetical protein